MTPPRWLDIRAAVATAAALRVGAAVVLLAAPQWFPMRDYEAVAPADLSTAERILHRPRYAPIAEDETAYDALARSLARGDGLALERNWVIAQAGEPTAYGGALYPLFVALLYKTSGDAFPVVVLLQIALSVAAVYGMWRIGTLAGGETTGLLAAWGGALHPGLVMAPSLLMTEALSIPCIVAVVLAAAGWAARPTPRRAALVGLLIGAAFLLRSPLGVTAIVVAAAAGLVGAKRGRLTASAALRQGTVLAVVAAATLTPWVARNASAYGRLLLSDSKSGVNLWVANRPPEAPEWPDVSHLNEAERDAHFRARAAENIVRSPGWFAHATLVRMLRYWWPVPWPVSTPLHWIGIGLYAAGTLLALAGLAVLARRLPAHGPEWLVLAGVVAAWGLSALTAVGLRHRLAAEPLLMVCAALGLGAAIAARTARRYQG
jgi:4-amino-4-deoxy-L-arabinose transferase-like glycosyltransferase